MEGMDPAPPLPVFLPVMDLLIVDLVAEAGVGTGAGVGPLGPSASMAQQSRCQACTPPQRDSSRSCARPPARETMREVS